MNLGLVYNGTEKRQWMFKKRDFFNCSNKLFHSVSVIHRFWQQLLSFTKSKQQLNSFAKSNMCDLGQFDYIWKKMWCSWKWFYLYDSWNVVVSFNRFIHLEKGSQPLMQWFILILKQKHQINISQKKFKGEIIYFNQYYWIQFSCN